ncbi:MAG: peptidoglycan DD-metalloendopeptidase family protein [bacterium]|nr:peptidoglycan DD-metalloendopeptidase family protein [bacterium]
MSIFIKILLLVIFNVPIFIIFIPSAKATSLNQPVLFYEDFSSNLNSWRIKYANWYIDQDSLVSKEYGLINHPGRIEAGEENWKNFRLEADLNNLDGIDSGIGFRMDTLRKSSYELTIRHGSGEHGIGELSTPQIFLQKVYWKEPYISFNSSIILGNNTSFPLNHNQWYHFKIEVIGNNIKVWVDNSKLFDVNDNQNDVASGFMTLASWTGKFGKINILFDNIKVTSLDSPQPFLDLPWDYRGMGKTFEETGLNPYSWFDHQYPLQNFCCDPPVLKYTGETTNEYYRSHSGYDYSLKNGVKLNTPVLAAAGGLATFVPWQNSGGAGNMIKIDHENGYQTWYEHLSSEDLAVSTPETSVPVSLGQQIGKVGMTGKTNGPHIHFSVFADNNNNGVFSDDYPFGLVDPLGWEGANPDPWTLWNSEGRTGSSSYNLFLPASQPKVVTIPTTGGTLATGSATIFVPSGSSTTPFNLSYKTGPFEKASEIISSIMPSFFLEAFKDSGEKITSFSNPITITLHYSLQDLFNINEDSLKIYLYNTFTGFWEPLDSTLNKIGKTVSAPTSHLSHFALMGEVQDLMAPTTSITLEGEKGQDDWYRSPVSVTLAAEDNLGGVGLEYILYTLNNNDWNEYQDSLNIEDEGEHQIIYQAYDKAENQEATQSSHFKIDKIPPEISVNTPAEGAVYILNQPVTADWSISDNLSGIDEEFTTSTTPSGNPLDTSTPGSHTFSVSTKDLAGNLVTTSIFYSINYLFGDLQLSPQMDSKIFKKTSSIPIKFQLTDNNGNFVSTAAAQLFVDDVPALPSGKSNTDNLFRYDSLTNQYVFNLSTSTPTLTVGTHLLKVTLDDGTEYSSLLNIR